MTIVREAAGDERVHIRDLLPRDLRPDFRKDFVLEIPHWAFRPDQWSFALLRGLSLLAPRWQGKRIWEVGVGTGLNLILLARWLQNADLCYSDYDSRCVRLATRNLLAAGLAEGIAYFPLHESWDLVVPPPGRTASKADVIFGCLPQVPAKGIDLTTDDRIAHYYRPENYPESAMHACGLGLNDSLLVHAKGVLETDGTVVLNLGGRPGIARLTYMFRSRGYSPRVVHEEMIAQHTETSLAGLVALEGNGHPDFEFFTDPHGRDRICAHEAETRRVGGQSLFHKIYVIEGTLA